MNALEQKMISMLKDLKDNYNVVGVKTEFETETIQLQELQILKDIATEAGLELTLKISGCGSIRDICDAGTFGISSIVAPMIESVYAAKKFIKTVENIISYETKLFLNIETTEGVKCIDEILNADFSNKLSGIVFGRTDMTNCLNIEDDVNNETILIYAQKLAKSALKYKKELIIGGGISALSIPFFKQLPQNALTKFETRKIIFDAQKALLNENIVQGIEKAIEFELMWIKDNKTNLKNNERIAILESRLLK